MALNFPHIHTHTYTNKHTYITQCGRCTSRTIMSRDHMYSSVSCQRCRDDSSTTTALLPPPIYTSDYCENVRTCVREKERVREISGETANFRLRLQESIRAMRQFMTQLRPFVLRLRFHRKARRMF